MHPDWHPCSPPFPCPCSRFRWVATLKLIPPAPPLDPAAARRFLVALAAAEEVLQSEAQRYTPLLQPHLPPQPALVAATLHRALGARLLPWLHAGGGIRWAVRVPALKP